MAYIGILLDGGEAEIIRDGDGAIEEYKYFSTAANDCERTCSLYEHYTGYIVAEVVAVKDLGRKPQPKPPQENYVKCTCTTPEEYAVCRRYCSQTLMD